MQPDPAPCGRLQPGSGGEVHRLRRRGYRCRKKSSQVNILDNRGKRVTAEAAIPAQLSLGSAIVAGEWGGPRERLGRNRPALRGFNSEKEASWTG
jgi:hypothetical protein